MSESALDSLDREVERLKQNFNSNREMFENVSRWQSLFVKFLDFEVQSRPHLSQKFKQSHPNIYTHVGDDIPSLFHFAQVYMVVVFIRKRRQTLVVCSIAVAHC